MNMMLVLAIYVVAIVAYVAFSRRRQAKAQEDRFAEPRVQQWEILLKARAVENQAFVVAVNRVGTGPDDVFSGHSMVIDPLGNVVLQSKEHEEGIFTADINLEEVDKVRGQIPVFEDRRTDLYH